MWECACKAGNSRAMYGKIDTIAWYKENSDKVTHQVGQKEPNRWGLYDMLGNVWEWCWDIYALKVYGTYRIFRSRGWNAIQTEVVWPPIIGAAIQSFTLVAWGFGSRGV